MLVRVEVRTRQGALLTLPLEDDDSGIVLEEIEGLDPVKATLVSSSFAGVDGEQYHSAHREARNIKIKLALEPDYISATVGDLRNRLYAFFMPKAEVSLRFVMDTGLYLDISGRVESFDAPLFTDEPEADLSLMCYDPDFVDTQSVKLSKMSVSTSAENKITYDGTVDVGGKFTIRPDRAVNAFTLYLRKPDGSIESLDFSIPLVAGDKLEISTVTGAKGVTLTRSGTISSALYGVSPQSAWLNLQRGDNYLRLYATGNPIPFDFEYSTRYGGL